MSDPMLPELCGRCGHGQDAHAGDKDCMCGYCMWFIQGENWREDMRAKRRDELIDNLAESLSIPSAWPVRTVALLHLTAIVAAMAEDAEAEPVEAEVRHWAAAFARRWIGAASGALDFGEPV